MLIEEGDTAHLSPCPTPSCVAYYRAVLYFDVCLQKGSVVFVLYLAASVSIGV
jgi:hypothetical protein